MIRFDAQMSIVADVGELYRASRDFGIRAFTTTRAAGSFGTQSDEPVREVMARWARCARELRPGGPRFATATQVHGARCPRAPDRLARVAARPDDADGHASVGRGTALAVTVADCVPVFIAHPSGAIALLHSGWRGTAGRIVERGIAALAQSRLSGRPSSACTLGPAICGRCYEVSADVYAQLTGRDPGEADDGRSARPHRRARARGSACDRSRRAASCTRCDNDRFFSHRAGDAGRQLGVMIADM